MCPLSNYAKKHNCLIELHNTMILGQKGEMSCEGIYCLPTILVGGVRCRWWELSTMNRPQSSAGLKR